MKHLASLLALTWLLAASASPAEFDHTHAALDQLLKKHVTDALVDYPALKADSEKLDACLDEMAAVRGADFQNWTQLQKLAFLINLYNAATLRLVLDHHPVKSIKKIGGLLSGPWDQPVVRLFAVTVTLGHVEHEILRKKYNEPRIHFAIVCAALGCPPLRSEAYLADKLDTQLADQGEKFLGNARKNSVDAKNRVVNLSPIFKWFSGDFEKKSGTVLKFVAPFFSADAQAEMAKGGYKISYTDYDWSLNEKK